MIRQIYRYFFFSTLMFLGMANVFAQKRQQIILKDNWLVKEISPEQKIPEVPGDFSKAGSEWYTASMPKQVQELVFEKNKLPDPHYGDNAAKWTDVFEQDWVYTTRFNSPESSGEVFLCFDGLDTRADILLNGQKIAECNSMFRHFRFPVKKILAPRGKENILIIHFYSPTKYISSITAKVGRQPYWNIKYLRKCISDFSSYMGSRPNFIKMGIFDNVYLDVVPASWLGDVYIRSRLNSDFSNAKIVVSPDVTGSRNTRIMYLLNAPDGKIIKQATISVSDTFIIDIDKPELWWPLTYGPQSLYKLSLSVMNGSAEIDKQTFNVGIRDIKMFLKDKATGEDRFGFIINGKTLFMHGACWAPLEGFTHVWDEKRANRLLDITVWGNMNILRVWGEGSLPGKSFYDECDKRGILVWQEFFTGTGLAYPLDYPGFIENIEAEAENMIKLLRNHSSIAMWCGGNEHYLPYPSISKGDKEPVGRELLEGIFPAQVTRFHPGTYYLPSSPWGGENWPNGNYPLSGDYHDYGAINYEPLATVPLFPSETGKASPYSLHNMKQFLPEEDLWPKDFSFKIDKPGKIAWPAGWNKHTPSDGWLWVGPIENYLDIQNVEDAIRVLGTAQGDYTKERYERQRRGVPEGQPDGNRRSGGAMIWRLNDTWPIVFMSVIDYYLEPKIPYYFLKRACSSVLISFEQTTERICTWVVNDSPETINDSLIVEIRRFDGRMRARNAWKVNMQPGQSKRIADLTCFHDISKRGEFIVARLGNQVITHLLCSEKYLYLPDADIKAEKTGQSITLSSTKFVKEVELLIEDSSGAVFSDNYFNLIPGESRTVKILNMPDGGKTLKIKGVNSSITTLVL